MRQVFDMDKFKELVLYVSERSETDPKFGYTKLNKLLYYIDFTAYRELGGAVTGATYHRLENGPAPVKMKTAEREMTEAGALVIRPSSFGGMPQSKPIALRQPSLGSFSGEEIALADRLIVRFWDMTATGISEYSHEEIGWSLADFKEVIPYETAFIQSIAPVPST